MSEAMMDSITLLMIERRLIGLVAGICFCTFLCRAVMFAISKQMADDLEQMRG